MRPASTPWSTAAFGALLLAVGYGLAVASPLGLDAPLMKNLGWLAGTLPFRDAALFGVAALLMPLAGIALDRFGIRASLLGALAMLAAGLLVMSFSSGGVGMRVPYGLFALVAAFWATLAVAAWMTQDFQQARGTATGLALAGTSLGGLALPLFVTLLFNALGWTPAVLVLAALTAGLFFAVLRLLPATPDATTERTPDEIPTRKSTTVAVSFRVAVGTLPFWSLALCGLLLFFAALGVLSKLPLHALLLGTLETDLLLWSGLGAALVGQVLTGLLADRANVSVLLLSAIVLMATGAAMLALGDPGMLTAASAVFGLGWGGAFVLFFHLPLSLFGLRHAGRLGGVLGGVACLGAALGSWLLAALADWTGSYSTSFWLAFGALAIALLLATQIKPLTQPMRAKPV